MINKIIWIWVWHDIFRKSWFIEVDRAYKHRIYKIPITQDKLARRLRRLARVCNYMAIHEQGRIYSMSEVTGIHGWWYEAYYGRGDDD
jgi:hypothetical protein